VTGSGGTYFPRSRKGRFPCFFPLVICSVYATFDYERDTPDRSFFGVAAESVRQQARARIAARIDRLARGNPGDVAPVGEGVSEMRIHYGPGYRVYFVQRGAALVLLLCGGDKSTQARDIRTAKQLVGKLED
jgi:putative addiction module killer protein